MKTSELIKILKKAGCYKLRSGGSHDIWISPMTDKKFQVPRHVYPAIFHPEKEGGFSIFFPDIEGCYTQGDTMVEAVEMAEDALNLMLWDKEENKEPIPHPSMPQDIRLEDPSDCIVWVSADTFKYRKMHDTKSVKKTLSIPRWLDTLATDNNINFSNVLQNALKKQLGV